MSLPESLALPLQRVWQHIPLIVTRARWLPSVGSTMDVVLAEAHRDSEAGLLVIADEQTAGRGRRGHEWVSPPGAGLYFSLLLRPGSEETGGDARPASLVSLLTLAAGVGVSDGIATATGLQPTLKWPNDVLVNRQKVAGILAEAVALATPAQSIALGIGINVTETTFPAAIARRATSIAAELGRPIDRGEVLAAVLVSLTEQYRLLLEARYDDVLNAWRARAPSADGADVEWDTPNGTARGVTAGIDDTGALLVRTARGMERLIAGEIRWR